jgi:tetratricopeptide (TPR) repeat protein
MAALVCALVFALHPAQTEAVVYAAARSTTLSTLATLAGLYAWERARDGARRRWIAACVAALAASLAAREAAWTLPFLVVLVEIARGERLRDALRASAPLWIALAAMAAVGASIAAHRRLLASSLAIRGPLDNLLAQVDAVAYLVTHPLATLRLNFDPDVVAEPFAAAWWLELACIVAVLAAAIVQLRRRPWLSFAILWFAVALLPTHGVLARLELANDRQLYLAMLGPGLAAGVALASMRSRALAAGAAVALTGVLGIATFVRVSDYASESRLWTATVKANPANARAWNNLGYALAAEGDAAGARTAYERALALDPASPRPRANLDALRR